MNKVTNDYKQGYVDGLKSALNFIPHHWCSGESIRTRLSALINVKKQMLEKKKNNEPKT